MLTILAVEGMQLIIDIDSILEHLKCQLRFWNYVGLQNLLTNIHFRPSSIPERGII